MKITRKKSIFLVGIFCGLILSSFLVYRFYSFQKEARAAGPPSSNIGWNWNNATGWISDNCLNDYNDDGVLESHCTDAGYLSDYSVVIDKVTEGASGEAWSPNVGWIKFDPPGPGLYPVVPGYPDNNPADNSAPYNPTTKELSGWAKLVNPDFGDDAWIRLRGPVESAPGSYALCRVCVGVNPNKSCDFCYELIETDPFGRKYGAGKIGTQCIAGSTSGVPPITSCLACSRTYQYGVVALGYDLGVNGVKNVLEGWAYNGGTDNKNIGWIHFNYAYANLNAPLAFDNFLAKLTTTPLANACKSADLSWQSSSWANKYEILKSGSATLQDCAAATYVSSYQDVSSVCSSGSCLYQDSSLAENTYYCFKVKAVNDYDSTVCTNNTPTNPCPTWVKTPLCAPDNFTADGKTCGEITLRWDEEVDATGYEIYRGLKSDACNTLDPVNGVYPSSCPKVTLTINCGFAACGAVNRCCAKDEDIIPRQNYYYNLTALTGTDKSPATETFSQTLCYKGAEWQEE